MASYLIRLDDACPTMNHENWQRMEALLDQYQVKPIVGVIPENQDPDFNWPIAVDFWQKVAAWQQKDWCLALHGLHHKMHSSSAVRCYQKSHSIQTEYAGLPEEQQAQMLQDGLRSLKTHGIVPKCFFAPAHTYDAATVKAVKRVGVHFISDGYAFRPYQKDGMTFIPSICDGPFKMPFGMYTFVFHPSVMKEAEFRRLEQFRQSCHGQVTTAENALKRTKRSQGIIGHLLEYGIYLARGVRKAVRKH